MKPYLAARMCPACGGESRVYRSEELPDGTIRRKRRCLVCGHRFQTIEQLYLRGGNNAEVNTVD